MAVNGEQQTFRPANEENICFIPDDLKAIVVRILKGGDTAGGLAAAHELYARVEQDDPYFVASAVYEFLWKRVASESRRKLYSVVGDFFLTALERQLGQIGPNNMSSRFREIMECYSGAGDIQKMLEGPLYCVDLFLLKTTQLALGARNAAPGPDGNAKQREMDSAGLEFLADVKLTPEQQIHHCLQLAKDALIETHGELTRIVKQGHELRRTYIDFIRASLDRLTQSWQQWQELHDRKGVTELEPDEYFRQGIDRAEKLNSLVLAALLLEQAGEEYQDKMCREFLHHRFSNRPVEHPRRGCTFDAGEIYRDQGIVEREHGAYLLGERRFTHAIELFGHLHDRTSIAHTLIERARLYMTRGTDAWKARADLHLAVQNIAAAQNKVPIGGPLPKITPLQVAQFYRFKGLTEEADAYSALEIQLEL